MENYPFDTTGLSCDIIDFFDDTYKSIKAKLDIQLTGDINFQLDQFEVFRTYENVRILGSFVLKQECNNDSYILFVEATNSVMGRIERIYTYHYQTWAVAFVKKDFDRVLIRRETLADKIIELVHPVELDFEDDKSFSDAFYVLVNDRDKALKAIDRNFRNAVMDIRHEDFVIEVNGHTLVAGSQLAITPEQAVYLAGFVTRVCSLC